MHVTPATLQRRPKFSRHCNQWGLRGVCVRQCRNRRSCGLGGACGGPRHCCVRWRFTSCKGKGSFWGLLFHIFTLGNAIGSPTVNCFRFVCENLTTFPFGKRIIGKIDSWALWRHSLFQDQSWGLWEITKKVTTARRQNERTQQSCGRNMHIHEWSPRRTAHRPRPEQRFGYACWPPPAPWETFAATRPCSQIILGRLVLVVIPTVPKISMVTL